MDEQAHWLALREGDMDGLQALYKLHGARLYTYGMMLAREEDKVQDAIHDLFLYLWQQRERITIPASGKAYLMVSLRRRLFDKRSGLPVHTEPVEAAEGDPGLASEDAETEWIRGEEEGIQAERLTAAMARLSDRQREILHMKYYERMDYEAIGELMGLNYQSARNLVNRAVNALRREMIVIGAIWLTLWLAG